MTAVEAAKVGPVHTIGVAVAIPEPWATRLQAYRASLGDAAAATIPTHITLIPPAEVREPCLDELEEHLAKAAASLSAFEVHLRGTGTFRPVSPVVFVALARGISHVEQLAAVVRSGPLVQDLAFPYHPHVTVAHHLDDVTLDRAFSELADFECDFEVTSFHLYLHDGDEWQPAREFALGGGRS